MSPAPAPASVGDVGVVLVPVFAAGVPALLHLLLPEKADAM